MVTETGAVRQSLEPVISMAVPTTTGAVLANTQLPSPSRTHTRTHIHARRRTHTYICTHIRIHARAERMLAYTPHSLIELFLLCVFAVVVVVVVVVVVLLLFFWEESFFVFFVCFCNRSNKIASESDRLLIFSDIC